MDYLPNHSQESATYSLALEGQRYAVLGIAEGSKSSVLIFEFVVKTRLDRKR